MSPAPQCEDSPTEAPAGNRVVISGMSGLYPRARYIRDLENILYNKIDPVTSEDLRWKYAHPEVAQYTGKIPDVDRFDAQFFRVHYLQGNSMDSMSRKLLEQAYEAIYDAGLSPEQLTGKKVGVYIGTCFSETEKAVFYVANNSRGFGISGCCKAMFANRISYWLNAKGPSMSVDDSCCSSTLALEQAYLAIARGECEAAIVGGANLCLHPQSSIHFGRVMKISTDGKTKSFDQNAAGCSKSEAINVLFLQKAENALRIYANVVHAKCEYVNIPDGETGPRYGFYRDPEDTAQFLKRFYSRAGVPPNIVEYVEGFGSAVSEVDKSELEAFDKIFCRNRDEPLMVGSIMSNIGYGEAASGISAVTKVLLGYHRGEIAGNLNYETPRSDVAALKEGRIRVLDDHQHFRGTYAAVNGFSVTGVNAHVLLHGHNKAKNLNRYKTSIPYLVTISGRQNTSVERVLEELTSHPIDPEQLALLHNIHETRINGHLGRGYIILDTKDGKTVSLSKQADYFDTAQRPLWFVYSGMGSQWPGMGAELMRLPIFAAAIERCRQVLEPKGIDIVHIITSTDKTIFDNILHSFVGIAAVQIGLTDVLRELGLVPDKIIGHSVGELGCAYADGCLTAEEMILSAYSRGLVSLETPFIRGSMAAVGLGFQQVSELCPPEIEIACHNSADSCTISGPAEAMQVFVSQLVSKGIFAKEVPCSNIAYHSRYIAKAGPALLKYLKEVILTPRARSDRWFSTSVPQDKWETPAAKLSSAEYHTNNLLSPVLFEETSKLIPSNAVLIEIAPHGLLQAILKRSLPGSCTNIPLTRRGHAESPRMVLEAVGKLYMEGYNPKVRVLYPKVEFPVSTGTPMLSHLVDWAHHEKWSLPLYVSARRNVAASCKFLVSIYDDEHNYLRGHVIGGKLQLPFSFALVAAWDTLAMSLNVPKKELSVVFEDVQMYAQPLLYDQHAVKLTVSLHRGSGRFEILYGSFRVVTGFINVMSGPSLRPNILNDVDVDFNTCDIYRLFYERDHLYSGEFRCIYNASSTLTEANILWNDNWVTLIDGMLQLNALKRPHNAVSVPSQIRSMTIDVTTHQNDITTVKDGQRLLKTHISEIHEFTQCGGVLIENLKFRDLLPTKENSINLKSLKFVPRFKSNFDTFSSLQILIQIVAENINKDVIKIVGIAPASEDTSEYIAVFGEMKRVSEDYIPGLEIAYRQVAKNTITLSADIYLNDADILLVQDMPKYMDSGALNILQGFFSRNNTFVINESSTCSDFKKTMSFKVISSITNDVTGLHLELLQCQSSLPSAPISVVIHSDKDLPKLINARNKLTEQNSLVVISAYPPFSGLKSLVKDWRKDISRNKIKLIVFNNAKDNKTLAKIPGDLAFNIMDQDVWGGEYYVPLENNTEKRSEVALQSEIIGNFDSLKWVHLPNSNDSCLKVKVHYAGINMSDVLRASGAIPSEIDNTFRGYAMDFSGVTLNGERVMGLIANGAARSQVVANPELLWPVPSHWSLEDAATVPLAYVYAYYCLDLKTNFVVDAKICEKTGLPIHSLLVHGGAGALGQAVISVALSKGYRVFSTVSSLQKKRFLLKLFPELRDADIGYSRDASFADMVLIATESKGCDLVICCLKGQLKNASLKVCSTFGTTMGIGQIENSEVFNFGMNFLTKERNYKRVDITSIFQNLQSGDIKRLHTLVSNGIAQGHVRPLSRVSFAPEKAARAFRLLEASRHCGRVLLRLHQHHSPAHARFSCSGAGCHVIFCDAQPLGLQLADLLIDSGAKNIHLHYCQPPTLLSYKLSLWKKSGVEVSISSEDLTDDNGILNVIEHLPFATVDGVYLAANVFSKLTTLTAMNATVNKMCSSIKYFLMFGDGDDSAQYVSLKRTNDGLPATVINLSSLEKYEDNEGLTWYQSVKEVVKHALNSSRPVIVPQVKTLHRKSLVLQIETLADISISAELNDNTSLEDLGVPLEKSLAISSFLRDSHNIFIPEDEIPILTIKRIKEIELSITETAFKEVEGLDTFYSYMDPDEMLATTEMVLLPTLTNNATMRDDEFDMNETFMCVVPGLEGHHERFRSLCERLKLPAIVLQPGFDHLEESVQELALRYSKVLLKRAGVQNNFYLLGYESGVLVALELAAILEQYGQTGTVFCLGDGPEETKQLIKEQLREFDTDEALQMGLLQHMFTLMSGQQAPTQHTVGGTWRQRVDGCVRTLLGHVSHSAQYARGLIEAAYARIASTINYSTVPKVLKSRIVVLRALSPHAASVVPCSLQQYSLQPIIVHNLSTPLAHVAKDKHCTSIINRYLSKEILEAYESKNLCESYLLNADTFMATS